MVRVWVTSLVFTFVYLSNLDQNRAHAAVTSDSASIEILRIGDATHLEFSEASNWDYRIEKVGDDRVRLRVPRISKSVTAKLNKLNDPLISVVSIVENGVDGTAEIVFKLKDPKTEFFEYTTSEPAKFIVDFFQKDEPEPKVSPGKPKRSSEKVAKKQGKAPSVVHELPTVQRTPAGDYIENPQQDFKTGLIKTEVKYGLFDGGDPEFSRFSIADYEIREQAIIASRDNIYINFPMLGFELKTLESILAAQPIYEITPQENDEENEQARLLIVLFKNKRSAIFLQTASEFLEKYPKTRYDEIIRFMMADTHYNLWRESKEPADFETSMGLYRSLTERYADSPLRNRTLLLMGYSYVEQGDSFSALTTFQRYHRLVPDSKHHDHVQLAVAQSYLKLGRFSDAYSVLEELERNGRDQKLRWEAKFRKGDIYFKQKDFDKSLSEYEKSLSENQQASLLFPSIYYNKAEALFQKKKYKDSLNAFRDFLKNFPSHAHGGYALTRVGELLDILGAPRKRVMGAYLESTFRFRSHPGASLARLRFLTGRFPDLKEKELESALLEIENLTQQMASLPEFQDVNELTTLVVSDGLTRRRNFARASQILIQKYQQNPQSNNRQKYLKRIINNITQEIQVAVDNQKFIDALRIYSRNLNSWLKSNDRIDTDYLEGRSYEQAGAFSRARQIYDKTYKRLEAIRGSEAEKEHSVYEKLPTLSQLNLRIASVALQNKDVGAAEDAIRRITEQDIKEFTDPEVAERAEILTQIFQQKGDLPKAIAYLKDLLVLWKSESDSVIPLKVRYARMLTLIGDEPSLIEAEASLRDVEKHHSAGGSVNEKSLAEALELGAQVAEKRGDRKRAIDELAKLLRDFESKRALASARYHLGRLQFEEGLLPDAQDTWAKLDATKDGVWRKLADEQMSSQKWMSEFRRYIDRIPAAEPSRRAKQ